MKKKDARETVKGLSKRDLLDRLEVEKQELTKLKLTHAVNPIENPYLITEKRKFIARLKTQLVIKNQDENTK